MRKLIEKLKFKTTCNLCAEEATHMIKVLCVCKTCLNELLECIVDAIKED